MSESQPPPPKPKGTAGYLIVGSALIAMAGVAFVMAVYNDNPAITYVGAVLAFGGIVMLYERRRKSSSLAAYPSMTQRDR